MEANLEIENLGKRSGITDVSITNRIQEIEERISVVKDTIEEIGTIVKENSKHKKKKKSPPKATRKLRAQRKAQIKEK